MSEQHLGTKMDSCTETQTETFEIPIPELFDDHLPKFEKPTEIGYFSLDIDRKFEIPEEKEGFVRYFIRPANPDQVNFDLRKGYDTRIIKAKGKEFNLLTWIKEQVEVYLNPEDTNGPTKGASGSDRPKKCAPPNSIINQSGPSKMKTSTKETPDLPITADRINRRLDTDFVCRRGLLVKIMLIPYETLKGWHIAVTLHNGTYYLHEIGEIAMTSQGNIQTIPGGPAHSTLPNLGTIPGPLPPLQAPISIPGMLPISLPPFNPGVTAPLPAGFNLPMNLAGPTSLPTFPSPEPALSGPMTGTQVSSQTGSAAASTTVTQGTPLQNTAMQGTSLPVNSVQGTSPLTNESQGAQSTPQTGGSTGVKPVQNEGAAAS